MALFDPDRHEALAGDAWDAATAERAIEAIVADVRSAAAADGFWPNHPQDEMAPGERPPGLYLGPAGVT